MKTLLFTIALILTLATGAASQQNTKPEVYPRQVSIEHNDAVQHFSRDFVTSLYGRNAVLNLSSLMGSVNNLASVNLIGDQNTAVLSQLGSGNIGLINVIGNYNETSLTQEGNNLFAQLGIKGDNNSLEFDQSGSYNGAAFLLFGNGLDYKATQTDAGMQLFQGGGTSIPFTIQRTGRTIPIIISHN